MTLRERIEQIAREAATGIVKEYAHPDDKYPPRYNLDDIIDALAEDLKDDYIRILTDPQIGYKEALDAVLDKRVSRGYNNVEEMLAGEDNEEYKECIICLSDHRDFDTGEFIEDSPCTCPCHTAEAKLKELKEMK